jgi:plasmid stabilization system protein ParE
MADYIITPRAEKDIDEILIFIATDNLDAARFVFKSVYQTVLKC